MEAYKVMTDEDIEKFFEEFAKASPFQYRYVKKEDEEVLTKVVEEMIELGYRVAYISDAGLKDSGLLRLTFLPNTKEFFKTGNDVGYIDENGCPMSGQEQIDVNTWLKVKS
jgi:16S rRNA C1402 (ribose-2'-O) methylase RsmI